MIGREAEWRTVVDALRSLGDGSQVIEVVGEPGIGKTRLLAELAGYAREHRLLTLTGRATEFESEMPFAVLTEALDDHVRLHGESLRARLPADDVWRLGEILDGLRAGPAASEASRGGAAERYRSLRALRRLLETLAEPAGLVLILDDVHWCDPATTDLIDYLLRRPPAGPVVLALSYRPAQAPGRLAAAFAAGRTSRLHRRLALAPLPEADVTRLLGPEADARDVAYLYRLCGGNPLYLDALRRCGTTALGAARTRNDPDPALAALPAEVRAALSAEWESVGPDSRLLASAAAVGGDESEPALLAEIAELPLPAVLRCLDELVARDLIQVVAGTGRFRFRHPLVRHVVYASAAAGWRLGAHARAAAALERVGAPPRARAHHVARSAAVGDTGAARTLVAAARAVGAQAPATAAEWLQTALRLLPGDTAGAGLPGRAELLTYLAERRAASGNLAEARQAMGVVIDELLPVGHPARPVAVGYTGVLIRLLGRHDEAQALLTAELEHRPDADNSDVLLQIATYALMRGRLAEADERLCQVIARAPGGAAAAIAHAMRSATGYATGPVDAIGVPPGSVADPLDTLGDEDIAQRLEVFAWLCWTGLETQGSSDSLRRLMRCRRIAVQAGQSFVLPYLLAMQALMQARLGRIGEAMRAAEEAIAIARLLAAAEPLALTLLTQCWLHRCAGDFAAAIVTGEQAVAAASVSHGWLATAQAMLAFSRITAGDVRRGAADLVAAGGGPELAALYPHNRLVACAALAEVAAKTGEPESPRHWADLAERIADPGHRPWRGLAMLARTFAVGVDDPARGAELAERAGALLVDAELVLLAIRAWLAAATLRMRAGDEPTALDDLARAEELGERTDAGDAHAALRRLSRRLRPDASPPPVPGAGELTRREGEIAVLIAAGMSNAEIAADLYVSVRTVETHVSRIYTKLGVTTRAAAVSRLVR
ncbi:AAA family ATPase [Actinoplanes sp. KI2]|uniref:helix-turn-helix transcriptional regulator n=1 Tax=Actinoplanes sp. KI2 TaxID=2983315 RepID=UPI0021D57D89|nr:AAA family ATPase [Actinoplanes sp. KI2]MCU7730693.1 AAA family ATPase [Actinoplanes sp. KI2]